MPGVELQTLSSNWKNLQKSLQKDKPTTIAPNPLKRKTTSDALPESHSNGVKRKKLETRNIQGPERRRRKMGSYPSKEPPVQPKPAASPSASLALFAEDNDIPAADVTAAYKLDRVNTAAASTPQRDVLNSGLNPAAVPGKYIALDCEMVGTGPPPATDSVLARVSLVNYHGQLLYDSYVLPPPNIAITDYRTFVSGIQPHHLRPGTARPFRLVQRDVAALLAGRVLVGHALKNDLAVLVLAHPQRDIRDTARHAAFRKLSAGRTPALKRLAREVLGVEIQGGEHSSVEDARAAMLLFRREKVAFEEENARRWGRSRRRGQAAVREAEEEDEEGTEEEGGGGAADGKKSSARKKKKKKGRR
ncbi:hypothetical protein B0A49_03816 [Cryomyces minteri]|uniref:RNA exonuclease 4 n=1 Tax=Cryomyces minteri TaxID=331657 RepID=A0A4U0X2G2_9PEZI|nr:hypothetical protein B0A49_03816 [Cryomyces minteri]